MKMDCTKIKLFSMIRKHDESHISGTGRVLDGVIFPGGRTVVEWRSENASITIFDNFEEFKAVHINPHPKNKTEIIWHHVTEAKGEGKRRVEKDI